MPYVFLALSLLALAIGPLIVVLAKRAKTAMVFVDSFVLVVVGGLVLIHVLPESIALSGWWVIVAVVLGAVFPILAERGMRPAVRTRGIAIAVALLGLAGHAMIDGAALAGVEIVGHGHDHGHEHGHEGHDHSHGPSGWSSAVAWAVIAHRLPVGIAIWWIVGRTLGTRLAVATLVVAVAGTIAGFGLGAQVLTGASTTGIGLFQGLLAGSLLHVLLHAHVPPPAAVSERARNLTSVAGALAALGVVYAVESSHSHGVGDRSAADVFVALALESAPVLVLAYFVAGLAHVFAPRAWVERINRGSSFAQALRGIFVGLPLPVCSCGVVPIYRGLVARGTAVAAAIAFLIATPELEIAAIFITWELMGFEIAAARVIAAAVLALVVGIVLSRAVRGRKPNVASGAELPADQFEGAGLGARMRGALRTGFVDMVDQTSPWILVGLGLSAMLMPYLSPEVFAKLPAGFDVPLAAALGMPLYVCASGSTPLAAVLVASGLSPGAALAFLLTGPATNVTTYGVLAGVHGRHLAGVFAASVFVGAVALGYGVNALLPATTSPLVLQEPHEHASPLAVAALVALAMLVFGSLLRRGTRGFIESLFGAPQREKAADSCCAE